MSKAKKTITASISKKTSDRIDILREEMFDSGDITFFNRSAVVEKLLHLGYNDYRMMHPRTDVDPDTAAEIKKHAEIIANIDKEGEQGGSFLKSI